MSLSVASIVATLPAQAASFTFSFSSFYDPDFSSGSGIFTTTDLPNSAITSTSVTILGISGTITSSTRAGRFLTKAQAEVIFLGRIKCRLKLC